MYDNNISLPVQSTYVLLSNLKLSVDYRNVVNLDFFTVAIYRAKINNSNY